MYADRITAAMQKAAGEAFEAFETRKRREGERDEESFVSLKDNAPQWVKDAVYSAHGDFLPDDWRYDKIQDAFGAIHDASEDADTTEVGDEFADGAVDAYTHARLQWLASNLNRPGYCDEAREEGLIGEDSDLVQQIGMGQYMEAREIWGAVLEALCEHVSDEIEDED